MKQPLLLILILSLPVTARVVAAEAADPGGQWPSVSPVEAAFHLVDHQQTAARLTIVGPRGTKLYLLECYLNAYDRSDPQFDYSGAFECRLTSSSPQFNMGYSTLLTEEKSPTRDWQSRGRFLLQEITGRCASYPEWGAVRHFRLRGMVLTLAIKDVKIETGSRALNQPWGVDRIESLDLLVEVAPDPRALSKVAERTKYVEPPYANPADPKDLSRNCDTVVTRDGGR